MTDQHSCPSKDHLVTYLYGDADAGWMAGFDAHLRRCDACAAEVDALGGVRVALGQWQAPELPVHVRLEAATPKPAPFGRLWPSFGLAAAAVLVLAAAAGLARVEVRSGPDGLTVRTGWGVSGEAATAVASPVEASVAPATTVPVDAPEAWRTELARIEQALRADLRAFEAEVAAAVAASRRTDDDGLLRRVEALLDDSEVRQQRNLALRVAELSRDFDLQRKADLVTVQQGLGRLESRTEAEAARAREMMNYIVRVSQQQAPQR